MCVHSHGLCSRQPGYVHAAPLCSGYPEDSVTRSAPLGFRMTAWAHLSVCAESKPPQHLIHSEEFSPLMLLCVPCGSGNLRSWPGCGSFCSLLSSLCLDNATVRAALWPGRLGGIRSDLFIFPWILGHCKCWSGISPLPNYPTFSLSILQESSEHGSQAVCGQRLN